MRPWLKKAVAKLRLYRLASGLYELYRLVVKPHTHGALVALWWEQRLLVVQCSYRSTLSLPGGGIERGETPRQAAVRELAEELGLTVKLHQLMDPWQIRENSVQGRNTVTIFALHAEEPPAVEIDGLEIVGYHWLYRNEIMARPIHKHLWTYLNRQAPGNDRSSIS